jgi:RNA polymerase sigma factor (sigma-70 family)
MDDEGHLARLMSEYQAGEIPAFERLYEALAGDVARYFESALGQRDTARDLMQETFMEIHRSRRTYLPPLPVRPWVFGVARNVLRRHRRTAWRRARHEGFVGDGLAGHGAPTWRVSGRIEARDVEEALRSVPAKSGHAWRLHHVHGYTFEEIARILRVPVGAARLRSSRAMGALRVLLGLGRGGRRG